MSKSGINGKEVPVGALVSFIQKASRSLARAAWLGFTLFLKPATGGLQAGSSACAEDLLHALCPPSPKGTHNTRIH